MFQTILFNAIVCTDYHTAEKLDHFPIKEIEHKAILCILPRNCVYECLHIYKTGTQLEFLMIEKSFVH